MNLIDAAAQLWPWALLIHATSSLTLVRPGAALFLGPAVGRCRLLSWTAVAVGLLPGVRVYLLSRRGPLPCREGVFFPHPAPGGEAPPYRREDHTFLSWEETAAMSADGCKLKVGGKTVFHAASPREAREWKDEAALLRGAGEAGRERSLERFGERGGATAAARRLALVRPWVLPLDFLGGLFLLCAYGLLPLALYTHFALRPDAGRLLLLLAGTALVLCALTISAHRHAHRAKLRHSLAALHDLFFYPLLSGGAVSLVSRDLLVGTDFTAACALLLPPESFRGEVRRELYALDRADRGDARFAEALDLKRKRLLAVCAWARLNPSDLRPEAAFPEDPAVAAYCPLCGAEFLDPIDVCPNCDVPMVARNGSPTPSASLPDRPV